MTDNSLAPLRRKRNSSIRVCANLIGEGKADAMVYRGTTGDWFASSSNGNARSATWGSPAHGDVPVPADYDGDGKSDFAVYRNTTGIWFLNQTAAGGATSHVGMANREFGRIAVGERRLPFTVVGDDVLVHQTMGFQAASADLPTIAQAIRETGLRVERVLVHIGDRWVPTQ